MYQRFSGGSHGNVYPNAFAIKKPVKGTRNVVIIGTSATSRPVCVSTVGMVVRVKRKLTAARDSHTAQEHTDDIVMEAMYDRANVSISYRQEDTNN